MITLNTNCHNCLLKKRRKVIQSNVSPFLYTHTEIYTQKISCCHIFSWISSYSRSVRCVYSYWDIRLCKFLPSFASFFSLLSPNSTATRYTLLNIFFVVRLSTLFGSLINKCMRVACSHSPRRTICSVSHIFSCIIIFCCCIDI